MINFLRYFDSLFHSFSKSAMIKYDYSINPEKDDVCFILDKGLGDFILYRFYFIKLVFFFVSQGKKITIITDDYNFEFIRMFSPELIPFSIILKKNSFEQVDGTSLLKLRGTFSVSVVASWSLTPRICSILRVLSPKKIYSIGTSLFSRGYCINDFDIVDHVDSLNVEHQDFYSNLHRLFVKKITGIDYGLKFERLNNFPRIINENYFVVNLDASSNRKLLSLDKFLKISKLLSNLYNLVPVYIGNNIFSQSFSKEAIKDFLNCRDLTKVASLCCYSKFVITSDTGILHLAALFNKITFVPTWSCKVPLFEPYPKELSNGNIHYIRALNKKNLSCFCFCQYKKCMHKCVPCVNKLSSEYVYREIVKIIDSSDFSREL